MNPDSKIYIAGHNGMVGSAIHRNLVAKGYSNFVLKTFAELDLTQQADVEAFFETEHPDYVFVAAAKVGGIVANNTYRAQFIYENLMIQNNIIHAAHLNKVKKLLFLGSSCIYPKNAPQPLKEEYLLTGVLEESNEPYAIAKIAGIKMCENYFRQYNDDFISVMPTNLYGPNDNYDLEKSHVLPALIRKMHLGKCLEQNDWASIRKDLDKLPIDGITGSQSETEILTILAQYGIKIQSSKFKVQSSTTTLNLEPSNLELSTLNPVTITLWGTGQVYREFLHVDDMADACVHIMQNIDAEKLYSKPGQTHINIGTGIDLTIKELAEIVKKVIGFDGSINWDDSKPDGTFKKQLDVSLLRSIDWVPKVDLINGIRKVFENYIKKPLTNSQ
ncbi:MAG: GDP-L-fucose synthase [Bacteroidales bacterium]|nr:GDP-L-fucose synthase [Bacteroidales bacterium]